jgi:hypothetical protein
MKLKENEEKCMMNIVTQTSSKLRQVVKEHNTGYQHAEPLPRKHTGMSRSRNRRPLMASSNSGIR